MMVASHNEETIRYTVSEMASNGIHPLDRVICFGQLLGMCDHISLPLGKDHLIDSMNLFNIAK